MARSQTIAVLTAELSEAYQTAIWDGITDGAEGEGHNLVCFLGSRVNSPVAQEAAANTVYDLANADNFDGLIVVSSAISTYVDPKQIQEFFDTHPTIPKVSIGVPVAGAGSVTVDARKAVEQVVDHLLQLHKRRRIAVIAGPKWHVESEQRRKAIEQSLRRRGVAWDSSLLVHGTFEQESGRIAVRSLLERGVTIDTLFCLNDGMALGALEELHRRGIRVPEDTAVVGFDGLEDTRYSTPPLTTIKQPLHRLGETSVTELSRLLKGSPPRDVSLSCEPLFRESCGCAPVVPALDNGEPEGKEALPGVLRSALEELVVLAGRDGARPFLNALNRHLTAALLRGDSLAPWERMVRALRGEIANGVPLFDAAIEMVGEMKSRQHAGRRIAESKHRTTLRAVGLSLSEAFETPLLLGRLRDGLHRIGFEEAYLILFERERNRELSSRLLLAHRYPEGDTGAQEVRFSRDIVVPRNTLDFSNNSSWMLVPLVFQGKALGYLLLPANSADNGVYETMGKQLASSLQGALLMDQVRGHEQSLEEEVDRRTKELIVANDSLRKEIETRIRLEKEVAEISRQTMERIGQDLHDDLCQYLAGISMYVSALENTLPPEEAEARGAARTLNDLLGNSVERAKAIVRGLLPVGLREEGLLFALNALADSASRSAGITILVEGSEAPFELDEERTLELYRILQEALNNSVKHSDCREIRVRLYHQNGDGVHGLRYVAEVQDDGVGIDERTLSAGMGLKIMRYRAEKTGADLSIQSAHPGTLVRCSLREPAGE